ncbi:hypothetical protein [Microbulbifer halophilus]|uniref:hypothetical protein n=1 Tax=Microbulbifer halophilus TaxID=453963 RepID=UPI003619A262
MVNRCYSRGAGPLHPSLSPAASHSGGHPPPATVNIQYHGESPRARGGYNCCVGERSPAARAGSRKPGSIKKRRERKTSCPDKWYSTM